MPNAALPLVVLLVFGFLLMRRGSRQRREIATMQASLVVGARVLTTSGLFATVAALDDVAVTLETGPGQQSRWDRRAVARILEGRSDEVAEAPSSSTSGAGQDQLGHPGGGHPVTEAADSSPTVAPRPPAASSSAVPDLLREPPPAPPARSAPDQQPSSDETTPPGSA